MKNDFLFYIRFENLFLKIPRITSLDDISADTVKELLIKYLENKGYQQINIQAALRKKRNDSAATRETVSNLSKPSL